jgi:NAD(P)-dependent dehydrogenase (short-subunit alcohol dehydrogenase family)
MPQSSEIRGKRRKNKEPLGSAGVSGRTALGTGGAGFIGSNLAESLLDQGWEVNALDDLSTGSAANDFQPAQNPYREEGPVHAAER